MNTASRLFLSVVITTLLAGCYTFEDAPPWDGGRQPEVRLDGAQIPGADVSSSELGASLDGGEREVARPDVGAIDGGMDLGGLGIGIDVAQPVDTAMIDANAPFADVPIADAPVADVPSVDVPGTGGATETGGVASGGSGGSGGTGGVAGGSGGTGQAPDAPVATYRLTLDPAALDFGVVVPGTTSATRTLTVTNTGDAATPALTLVTGEPDKYLVSTNTCADVVLNPGATCLVSFTFNPTVAGTVQAAGWVGPDVLTAAKFNLIGAGGGSKADLLLTPTATDFQTVDVNTPKSIVFTLKNSGTADPGTIAITTTGSTAYSVGSNGCVGAQMSEQGQCTFTVTFTPTAYGAASAKIVATASSGLVVEVTATGTGRDTVPLTVNFEGAGGGTVTGTGVSCATSCVVDIQRTEAGVTLALTAVPSAGSQFTGWLGGTCSGTGPCTINLSAPPTLTATFALTQYYDLTVTSNNSSMGTVALAPAGVACGTDCSRYEGGTSVVLSAKPAGGYILTSWSGDCAGPAASCTVVMSSAKTVGATFAKAPFTCTMENTGGTCTDKDGENTPPIRGTQDAATCHANCVGALRSAGSGCWLWFGNMDCYCRGGVYTPGSGGGAGGACF